MHTLPETAANHRFTLLCIGAHPDDCELQCSGTAAKFVARGARAVIVSVTDGRSGHHQMAPEAVAARRKLEAAAGARAIGAESRILGAPDGALEPTLEYRRRMITLVREVKPDLIMTNRPNDYHPDHRYTSLLVQDSAYMFMVPHVVPEVAALEYNPVILYWQDRFSYPREFRADIAVSVDEVYERKFAMLDSHESQVYEWLPWIDRYPEPVPPASDAAARREWLARFLASGRGPTTAERFRSRLAERYGTDAAAAVVHAEAFELCEYGAQPSRKELEAIFEGM
jgi:N-acetylglucosamine malate deacetylase 1